MKKLIHVTVYNFLIFQLYKNILKIFNYYPYHQYFYYMIISEQQISTRIPSYDGMQWGERNLTSVVAWNCGRRRANYLSSVVYVSDVCETFRSVREVNTCGDTRTSRDSGKIICNSQATVYAKTHPCTASRRST